MSRTHFDVARPALACICALAVAACTGPAAESTPPSFDELVASLGTDVSEAEQTCLQQLCASAPSAQDFATCRTTSCEPRSDAWSVVPTSIRHDGDTVFVQAGLSYTPGGFGPVDAPRTAEAYVGCTVITSTGEEIDLAVTTVFPSDLERPFTLSSDVGTDVRDVIFGVWDRKVEPCDSDRMGCQQYGFLLDGSLATWPPTAYQDGTRQRIPPQTVDVRVLDGGLGGRFPQHRDKALQALQDQLSIFGSTIGTVSSGLAQVASSRSIVGHHDDHDRYLARLVAGSLQHTGASADVEHRPDATVPFTIVLGGEPETWTQAQASCAQATGPSYDTCAAAL